jgi:hypothetical protein
VGVKTGEKPLGLIKGSSVHHPANAGYRLLVEDGTSLIIPNRVPSADGFSSSGIFASVMSSSGQFA